MLACDVYCEPFDSDYEIPYADKKCLENIFRTQNEIRKNFVKGCGALVVAGGSMAAELFSSGYPQGAFAAISVVASGFAIYKSVENNILAKEAKLSVVLADLRLNTGKQR